MDVLQDTRDKVITLVAEFGTLKERVEKNSELLEDLHKLQIQAKTGLTIGKAAYSVAKVFSLAGLAGALNWIVEHMPR